MEFTGTDGVAQVIQSEVDYRVNDDGSPMAYLHLLFHTRSGADLVKGMLFFDNRDKVVGHYNAASKSVRVLLPISYFEHLHRVVRLERDVYLDWSFDTDGKFGGFAFRTFPEYDETFPTEDPHPPTPPQPPAAPQG